MEGFLKIFFNFDLARVMHAVFLSPRCYSCHFSYLKRGGKKHSHKLARPAYVREKLTCVNTERSIKRGVGGQRRGELQRDGSSIN